MAEQTHRVLIEALRAVLGQYKGAAWRRQRAASGALFCCKQTTTVAGYITSDATESTGDVCQGKEEGSRRCAGTRQTEKVS